MKSDKATGPDQIGNRLLKATCKTISKPLCILFNLSLETKCFPECWKIANVIPLYKKGEASSPNNYRPVSLLSCISKVMERIMFKHMHNFLHDRNLLNKYQSGFQPGDSTVNQLIEIYDHICQGLENKKFVCMVFCDISKAFDRVWHDGLISKTKGYGFKNNISSWLLSYLTGRKQYVVLNGIRSSYLPVLSGVPRGSVLGPLLFLIYINDISDKLKCPTRLFADDSSLIASSTDINIVERDVNTDLENLSKWASDWAVTFNPQKTEVMLFTNRSLTNYPNIIFDNTQLSFVENHKHLGVYINSKGKWDKHIDYIINKCARLLGLMRSMKFKMSRMSLNKMYLSYIRPILEYADVLWDGCSNENESRIEKVQLEAARLVSGLTRSTSTNRIYQEIGWKTLHRRRKEKKLILFHKIEPNIAPSYLRDLLPLTVGQNTHYHLRNQMNFIEPRCRLDLYRKSFFPSTINMWNSLPQSLREITNFELI